MGVRKSMARGVRNLMAYPQVPTPIERMLRRLAHRIHPHVLRCRLCGAEFVAVSAFSLAHARDAYDHYVAVHESAASQGREFDTQ